MTTPTTTDTDPTPEGATASGVVDGFTHGGEGVVRVEGKAVFVPGALPGETVRLRIVDDRKRWARGELVEVVEASPDRVEPPCPVADECGGCDLQHVDPLAQVELKTRVVREQLERIGRFEAPPVRPGRAVGPALGYRAHARLHAAPDGRLGFHRAGTEEVVPVAHCPVLSPTAQALREAVGDDTGAADVTLRADGATTDDDPRAVVLAPGPGPLDVPEGEFDVLLEQPDGTAMTIRGDGRVRVTIHEVTYHVPADAFFQVSTAAATALVDEVLEAAGDVRGALTWDLYAGAGLFALQLARAGAEVLAVEGHRSAAAAAEHNAAANGLSLDVTTGDVREVVTGWAEAAPPVEPPDLVVLDPPRTGAGDQLLLPLVEFGPGRIVHVGCDPAAQARDVATLVRAGYRLQHVQPLDLFPMTHHVEAVALLTR